MNTLYWGFYDISSFFVVLEARWDFRADEVIFSAESIHEHVVLHFLSYPFVVFVEASGVEVLVTDVQGGFKSRLFFDVVAAETYLGNGQSVV